MKKLVSLILALAMVFAMAISANAAASDEYPAMTDAGTITIRNATAGHTYTLYRILNIAKVVPNSNPELDENVYIMNSTWHDFITTQGWTEFGYNSISIPYSDEYVTGVTKNSYNAQLLAEAVVKYAKAHGIAPDVTTPMTLSGDYVSNTPRQYGYYVMATEREGEGVKYTVFSLDRSQVTIDEKNTSKATLEKLVQEDSLGTWGNNNAAEIAQPVNFKIVAGLTAGSYEYKITDTMPNFRLPEDFASTFVVEYSGGGVLEQGTDYTLAINHTGEDTGFTMTLSSSFRRLVVDRETLTITYKALLKADATIAGSGNINTAVLSYTDKSADNITKTTTTYTYKLNVNKVNETGAALAGATFTLSNKDGQLKFHQGENNTYVVDPNGTVTSITTDGTGKFTISGLDTDDAYTLTETDAPDGYIIMDPKVITLTHNDDATEEVTVTNLPGVQMPTTGGMGTTMFYVFGSIMACAAAILLITKKRIAA